MEVTKLTKKRISEYLLTGRRFDGRKPLEFRDISIEFGVSKNAEGSAAVRIGNTEVVAGVKMAVGEPYPNEEDSGTMMVNTELLPLSSSRYELGPPQFGANEIARIVDRGIRESGMIDFKKLCIKEGEKVWTVFIDIYSINDDGNILDAASIAAIAALKSARMPKYDKEKEQVVFGEWTDEKLPLTDSIPLNITFHKIGNKFLIDPTAAEEDSADSRIAIALSEYSGKIMINSLQKSESTDMSLNEVYEVLDIAEETFKSLKPRIDKLMKVRK